MKKIEKICISAACVLALTFSTGAFIKVYAAETPVSTPGQPVDLTYAAEKALLLYTLRMHRTQKHKP